MFAVYVCVSSLEGRDLCTRLHTYTHKHKHTHFLDKTAGSVYTTSEKALFKKFHCHCKIRILVCILIILLHYHLAGNLVLINCQNVINYVKIVMYIQFSMLTWYKILVILFIA